MEEGVFQGWDSFYVIIGSAAAGLIGLLFIVVTLTASFEREKVLRAIDIYTTPVAVHFALVLTACAVVMAPRLPLPVTAALLGLCALLGLLNAIKSCIGIRQGIPGGEPQHWSDIWLYGVLPGGLHLGLGLGAVGMPIGAGWAPLTIAGVLLALLLTAIRNAWDLVTFMAPRAKDGDA